MMKLIFTPTLLALAVCFSSSAPTAKPSDQASQVEQQLMQMERDWAAAYLKHDTATINRILADDYVGIDGRGIITHKAQEIEEATAPAPGTPAPERQIVADTVTDMKVRVYGHAAVVTGRSLEKVISKGKEIEVQYRRTTVYIKRQGRWQCVSFHGSRIIQPPQ